MRHKSKKHTSYSKYKASSSSKLLNLNLTKNIIRLREPNFESEIQNKNKLNLNLNTEINSNNNNNYLMEISDSSNSYEYNNYIKSYRTNRLNNNNDIHQILNYRDLIQEDPQEIVLKERRLLFEHFISLVQFSEYDKLYYMLKKSGKFLDLNYRFDNGDTLLHICVRHSAPHYLIKLLVLYGADINSQNIYGDTALHIAVKNHKYKTIDLLIKLGASEYINNNRKKNCWECL
jgi:ankyrin repeat protein